jgi:hypothetical protein
MGSWDGLVLDQRSERIFRPERLTDLLAGHSIRARMPRASAGNGVATLARTDRSPSSRTPSGVSADIRPPGRSQPQGGQDLRPKSGTREGRWFGRPDPWARSSNFCSGVASPAGFEPALPP